jgi:transcription initiation factor TFIIIB Brf1 subunit/transcription initiation factor TFIIB
MVMANNSTHTNASRCIAYAPGTNAFALATPESAISNKPSGKSIAWPVRSGSHNQFVKPRASSIAGRSRMISLCSIEAIAASAVYAAARQASVPRTLDEVAAVARIEYLRIARAYRFIANELGLAVELADPREYLPRFASELECSTALRRQAHTLLTTVVDTPYLSGKNSVGLAAAALYAASQLIDELLTQDAISDVAGITVVTIRNHYRELLEHHDESTID